MILFKKYYKEANDDIKTNRALIADIFEKAEKDKVKKVVPMRSVYRFASCAAAVFALCAILYLYPHMSVVDTPTEKEQAAERSVSSAASETKARDGEDSIENKDEYIGSKINSIEKGISDNSDKNASDTATIKKADGNADKNAVSSERKEQNVNDKRISRKTASAAPTKESGAVLAESASYDSGKIRTEAAAIETEEGCTKEISEHAETFGNAGKSVDVEKSSGGGKTEQQSKQPRTTKNAENVTMAEESAGATAGAAAHSDAAETYALDSETQGFKAEISEDETVTWTAREYFDYLGINVFERIKLPSEMKNTSSSEFNVRFSADGALAEDEGVLTFESSDKRCLTLYTSKEDFSESFAYGGFKTKSIKGTEVYYNDGEGVCSGYMYNKDVGYVFYSYNMTRDELETALASLI